jgi:hypothetical protein
VQASINTSREQRWVLVSALANYLPIPSASFADFVLSKL